MRTTCEHRNRTYRRGRRVSLPTTTTVGTGLCRPDLLDEFSLPSTLPPEGREEDLRNIRDQGVGRRSTYPDPVSQDGSNPGRVYVLGSFPPLLVLSLSSAVSRNPRRESKTLESGPPGRGPSHTETGRGPVRTLSRKSPLSTYLCP